MHNTYSYIKYKKENEYLAHHGILGQKWGKKNGPPYPLDAEDHSAAEKKENHGHYSQGVTQDRGGSSSGSGSSSGAQNEPQNDKKQIDKKKILKAAAITAGVMTVVGGTSIGVALAVKEPEVFSNAFNDIKSAILQKSSDETIRNRTKESMAEGFKDKLREDTFNSLDNKDSAQVEARRIHDEATARREDRSRDDFRKSMNEGFRNSSSEEVKEARAEADASEKQQKTGGSSFDKFKEDVKKSDSLDDAMKALNGFTSEGSTKKESSNAVKEARAEADASKAAQEKAKANRYRSDFGKEFGEAQRNKNDEDLAEQMARGRESASNSRTEADTREGMKAQDAAYKARDKENAQYVKEGRREAFKEKVNNFNEAYKEYKEEKAANKRADLRKDMTDGFKVNLALNRLENGDYPDTDEGRDQRQADYNLASDKDPVGLNRIMDKARSKTGKTISEQTSNWSKMENTKRAMDKQNYNADRNAKQYEQDHPTTKFGKAKQKVEKATTWVNKAADTVNRTTGTVYKVKGAYDNAMRVVGMVGGIGTAVGAVSAANKHKQNQQYQQQNGYQDNINPQYQQQTQQFKKKKR